MIRNRRSGPRLRACLPVMVSIHLRDEVGGTFTGAGPARLRPKRYKGTISPEAGYQRCWLSSEISPNALLHLALSSLFTVFESFLLGFLVGVFLKELG